MPLNEKDEWFKYKYPDPFYGFNILKLLELEIRVKYLDQEDIESLEFKEIKKQNYVDWKFYYELGGITLVFRPAFYKDGSPNIYIHSSCFLDASDVLFRGKVKNKSELIKILKQID